MEMLKKLKFSRRFALRGALGGIGISMWLPVLDVMCDSTGTAFAAGEALPTSFGVFYWGNGVHADQWTPTATGSGNSWQLTKALASFADTKDSMTLVTGLEMLDAQFKGHGWGVVYVLAGGDGNICTKTADLANLPGHNFENAQATQYQMTIDQTIADAIHKNEPYKSFEVGMIPFTGDTAMGTVGSNLAHRAANNYLPPNRDPKSIFDKLFSGGTTTPPPATGGSSSGGAAGSTSSPGTPSDISARTRRSVLDAVLQDAKRLKMILGATDAARIDSHMDGIRELENRLPMVSGTMGGAGGAGSGTGGSGGAGSTSTVCTTPDAPPMTLALMSEKSQAINRLLVAALSCNLTRVFSHLWSGPRSDSLYPELNYTVTGHHAYTHGSDSVEPRAMEVFIMKQYADLASVMKKTPMGAGTVLDNTLIYGISEQGTDPHNHIMKDYHIVLMGKAGGKLAGNRHVRLTGRKVTELMLTMQQVMGLNVTSYGTWDKTNRTITEILT